MGLLIAWIVFILFAFVVFKIINSRTITKNFVQHDASITTPGVIYLEASQKVFTTELTLHPEKYITIKTEDSAELKLEATDIKRLHFPLTGSLATSYMHIDTTNQKSILFFNNVDEKQLMSKLGVTQVDSVLASSTVAGVSMIKDNQNSYYTSDEHTKLHVWLTKNSFPGYKSTLVKSDWVGFALILLLPGMVIVGITLETLSKLFIGNQETGTAFMGYLVILFIIIVSVHRFIQTRKLATLISRAKRTIKTRNLKS